MTTRLLIKGSGSRYPREFYRGLVQFLTPLRLAVPRYIPSWWHSLSSMHSAASYIWYSWVI